MNSASLHCVCDDAATRRVVHISGESKPLPTELEHMAKSKTLELKNAADFQNAQLGSGTGPWTLGGTGRHRKCKPVNPKP